MARRLLTFRALCGGCDQLCSCTGVRASTAMARCQVLSTTVVALSLGRVTKKMMAITAMMARSSGQRFFFGFGGCGWGCGFAACSFRRFSK